MHARQPPLHAVRHEGSKGVHLAGKRAGKLPPLRLPPLIAAVQVVDLGLCDHHSATATCTLALAETEFSFSAHVLSPPFAPLLFSYTSENSQGSTIPLRPNHCNYR
ncbi:hypothetical protein E2C01_089329 [Portunus trituberculatus]|uniref:Uncharacterized protein n=1 Tax=Portunus trituberculatus TaxID=210409 RepID=A0A5B7JII5_PORTR|nr:hypothetical protein [Portunus trituberculatus]